LSRIDRRGFLPGSWFTGRQCRQQLEHVQAWQFE
jgi:hypothetical protein